MIGDVMSQPVMVTNPDTALEEAVRAMLSQIIKKLPVVPDDDAEKLVGMLSLTDVAMTYPGVYSTMRQLQEAEIIRREPTPYIS